MTQNADVENMAGAPRRFPWVELALYLAGGFGVFTIASGLASAYGPQKGIWPIILVVLCNTLFIGGSAWTLGVRRKATTWEEIGIFPIRWKGKWLLYALGLTLALTPLRGLIGLAVSMLIEGGVESLQNRADLIMGMEGAMSGLEFAIRLLGVGVLVPISEELYFRGMLHRLIRPYLKFWPRVLISSTLFGLGHFDSIGVVVSSFIMGVVVAIAYERNKSLWLPVAIHAVTNSLAIVLLYAAQLLQNSPLLDTVMWLTGR
jgi:membrane protease YdiL (CAAX protease family)